MVANEPKIGPSRAIKFIHGGSELPVRDIEDKGKKEPYIEYGWERGENDGRILGAENFCKECYQEAVEKVVENDESHLFLATYPKHSDSSAEENQIIGYIRHEKNKVVDVDRTSVIGEIKLYPLDAGIPMSEYGYQPSKRSLGAYGRTFDDEETSDILERFVNRDDDVTEDCLQKVLELEGKVDVSEN